MGPLEVLSSSLYAVCIYAFAWDLHTYRDVSTSHSFTMHVANSRETECRLRVIAVQFVMSADVY